MNKTLKDKKKFRFGVFLFADVILIIVITVFLCIAYLNPIFYYKNDTYYHAYYGQFLGTYTRSYSDYNTTLFSSVDSSHAYIRVEMKSTLSNSISATSSVTYNINIDDFYIEYSNYGLGEVFECDFDITQYGIFPTQESKNKLTSVQIELAETFVDFSNNLINSNIYSIFYDYSITDVLYEFNTFCKNLTIIRIILICFDCVPILLFVLMILFYLIRKKQIKIYLEIDNGFENGNYKNVL